MTETREQMIARLERIEFMDPDCAMCRELFYKAEDPTSVFAPRHRRNIAGSCRSGRQPHCTCDSCF